MASENDWVRVRDAETGHEYTIIRGGMIEGIHEEITADDNPAVSSDGQPLPARLAVAASPLRGAELNDALEEAGLPHTGTVAEKQARLAEYEAAQSGQDVVSDQEGSN